MAAGTVGEARPLSLGFGCLPHTRHTHAPLSIRREVCAGGGSVGSETLDRDAALTLDPQRPATGPDERGCTSGMTPLPRVSHESDASAVCGGILKLFVVSVCCWILLLPLVSALEKDA